MLHALVAYACYATLHCSGTATRYSEIEQSQFNFLIPKQGQFGFTIYFWNIQANLHHNELSKGTYAHVAAVAMDSQGQYCIFPTLYDRPS